MPLNHTINCEYCGKTFHPWNKTNRFCSTSCSSYARPRPSVEQRFWSHVDKSGECWLWTASLDTSGYGVIGIKGKNRKANRVSWEMHYGPIPEGMLVCHNCPGGDNRRCVNPAHLWLGTNLENIQDSVAKGQFNRRKAKGTKHGMSKLDPDKVRYIRERRAQGAELRHIAAEIGVNHTTVWAVVIGETWKHVK